ncbi:hypothetical protein KA005_43410 [bacterium]|nr:hypothetical protein [bacterium]
MKQKYYYKLFFIIGLLIVASKLLVSQTQQKVIIISNIVGTLVDSTEKVSYDLFPEYPDEVFRAAQFFKLADGKKEALIYLRNGEKEKKIITEETYREYQKQINKRVIKYHEIDTSYVYSIRLIDETTLHGRFLEIKEKEIIFETNYLGIYTIAKIKILNIEKVMSISDSKSRRWFVNPHDTRHFFAPTARSLQKGEGYFQDVYLLLGFVNYGITDNILIGGGISVIPGIGIDEQLLFLNPKVGFQITDNLNLGGGLFYASFPGDNKRQRGGIAYGIGTYGNRENNVTLGLGYGVYNEESFKAPMAMLGGMYRISRRVALVTENWFSTINYEVETWPEHNLEDNLQWDMNMNQEIWVEQYEEPVIEQKNDVPVGIMMYGVRFFSKKLCVDLAFFNVLGDFEDLEFYFPGIPYLDFVVKF